VGLVLRKLAPFVFSNSAMEILAVCSGATLEFIHWEYALFSVAGASFMASSTLCQRSI
jgi:hypothetical protein